MANISYGIAKAWLRTTKALGMKNPSFRESLGLRKKRPTVIAVGGNSFEGLERQTAENIISVMLSGKDPIITHGNGPQVGKLLLRHPHKKLWECVSMTQFDMGESLIQELEQAAKRRGLPSLDVEIVPTKVIVDPKDPAFALPTKPIGPVYTLYELQAGGLGKLYKIKEIGYYGLKRHNGQVWLLKEMPGRGGKLRRVVASPKPLKIFPRDLELIIDLVNQGTLVIAVGGGGIPVSITPNKSNKGLEYHEAVIDKDLASALLAKELKARELIISTGVKKVSLNYGDDNQTDVDYFWAGQMLRKLKEGHFPVGSMGEKVEAGINFLRMRGNRFLITDPESDWTKWEGTMATRGVDLLGRFRMGKSLQRWLIT